MLKGFKDFLMKGNVVDLAVAFVMGTAFTAIVTAFSTKIINPMIAALGGGNSIGLGFQIRGDNPNTFIDIGAVITAGINFTLIAAVLYFVLVMPMDTVKKRRIQEGDVELSDNDVLIQIRDLLSTGSAPGVEGGKHGGA
ncbi:large conductance mechanosensitive channel protein MscL [Antrihabitans sp. YC2-6]|uniref:large conductance mechanosensitive channel protein MscL n=1 Tax=Antrihabitans sp. YC2-6 TaxID=2799498 RepID=UPI0018F7859A|nr:large conductance mechanosensitive channel protein MscL [Antrihabitans sp. YC2-6]MBJ8344084.1 large conductance mechanosensitive channel protein MscL [Antrihabitans sp. YC2-6]